MELFDLRLWKNFIVAGGNGNFPAWIDQVAIDSRLITSLKALFVALPGRFRHGHEFVKTAIEQGARYILVEEDYIASSDLPQSITLLYVPSPLRAMQEIAAAYRKFLNVNVIAITGSVGKTMLKDLLHEMLKQERSVASSPESFNSQIGVAMSLFLIDSTHQYAIIEAGISKVGEMDHLAQMIQPDYAILTKVDSSHLGLMPNTVVVTQEKLKLLQAVPVEHWTLQPGSSISFSRQFTLAWDYDYENLPKVIVNDLPRDKLSYQINFPNHFIFSGQLAKSQAYCIELVQIATKAAWLLGLSADAIAKTLHEYSFQETGSERWKLATGTTIINERYCADLSSLESALQSLQREAKNGRKWFVFGGVRREQSLSMAEISHVLKMLIKYKVDRLLLVEKRTIDTFIPYAERLAPFVQIETFKDYTSALQFMQSYVKADDFVLVKGANKSSIWDIAASLDKNTYDNILTINLAAIESNIAMMRSKWPSNVRFMAMVKAFGYGTDSLSLARFLEGCGIDIFGVAHVDEGIILKQAGIDLPIFAIHATEDEAELIIQNDFEVGVSSVTQVESFQRVACKFDKLIKVHLHIDTGMGRFGCRPEQALTIARTIHNCSHIQLMGVMTHFFSADNPQHDYLTLQQLEKFTDCIRILEAAGYKLPWVHAANSYGSLRFPQADFNMVRIGLGLFGLLPNLDLKPAVSLTSRIVGINTMLKGETVSYAGTYTVARDLEKIAVLPLGYCDGLHTQYSGRGYAVIRDKKAPFVGRICMDFMMVDITDIPEASIGDSALIFGKDLFGHFIDPAQLAEAGGTHVYQLLTCLGPRIRRIFTYDEAF